MAQSFATSAGVLKIPGAYPIINVQQTNSGLATTGILMLVGEADAGPDFTAEEDIASNFYGPNQIGDVQLKYKTGRLVDAFNGAAVAANDPQIPGSPAGFILVKTNASGKASAPLVRFDSTPYATLQDRNYGKNGNLISYQITAKVTEIAPTTGKFAMLVPIADVDISVRVNGGAVTAVAITTNDFPSTLATALDAVPGLDVTGGEHLDLLAGPLVADISLTVISGNRVQIDSTVAFVDDDGYPTAGDMVFVPTTSPLAASDDTNNKNAGSYVITAFSSDAKTIFATKRLDASGTNPDDLTPPVTIAADSVNAATDLAVYTGITAFSVDADPVDGYGKNFEINDLGSDDGLLTQNAWVISGSSIVAIDWASTEAVPHLIVSSKEYVAQLTDAWAAAGITEDIYAGGAIALKVGYEGTTATATIDGNTISFETVGGETPGAPSLELSLTEFDSIADLAARINSVPGFTAQAGTAVIGSQPSVSLDQGEFDCASTYANMPGRIKQDAYKFFTNLRDNNNGSLTVLDEQADSGLPAPTEVVQFLTGGTKGSTSDADIQAAFDALKMCRGNFLIPLFSRNATADIADNQTDTSSSYTIEAVHAAARSHVLQMSTLKKRRNRQAFLSLRSDFDTVKETAANLASSRCSLVFQDVRDLSIVGGVKQFQPWMNAAKAAGMQAAGFYKSIFNKGINISGALQAAGDFNDQDDDAVEQALDAGLLIVKRPEEGGFKYVSDQTTYGKDNNFVYNSIQAMYVADVIALTTAQRMEAAFVGQSLADVSASLALSTLEGIMEDMRRLKLVAFSDDAPKGFKNAVIRITGPAMVVSVEVKEATSLYFVPITFQITQVTQSA